MIERTKVEMTILYDEKESTDAVIMTEVYKKLGFIITDFDYPKKHQKGYYVMKLECESFYHVIFSLGNPDEYDNTKKSKKKK